MTTFKIILFIIAVPFLITGKIYLWFKKEWRNYQDWMNYN